MDNENKSWISQVFESITNGFTNVLASIKQHGWKAALYTFIIIGLLWSIVINPIRIGDMVQDQWQKHLETEKVVNDEKTEESISRREKANFFVSELMLNIIDRYENVNRVLLLEKHNGSSSLKGVDFLYSSCTYELVNNNITDPLFLYEDLQKQTNLNLLGSNLIQTLKHKEYVYFDDLEKQKNNQCRLLRKLYNGGDKQCIIFSFKDNKHRPIILLVISGDNLDDKSIEEYIGQFKKQIEELLID